MINVKLNISGHKPIRKLLNLIETRFHDIIFVII